MVNAMHLNGIPILVSEFATQRVCKVERLPIKKRRRGYRVRAQQVPGMYQIAGGAFVLHPTLYAQLQQRFGA